MSEIKTISGVCPIVTTPFTSSGEVDETGFRNLSRWLANGGCGALTLFGIAGEYYKLTEDERRRMVRWMVEECRGAGVPSIISVTDHATEVAVARAREWEAAGADCLMLLPPFFLKPGAAALIHHMKAVIAAVQIPVMLQYAPEQTGVAIPAENLWSVAADAPERVIFKIENRPPGLTISRIRSLSNDCARIFIGNAGFQLIEGLDRGACGVMPGCSMFDVYQKIMLLWQQNKRTEAFAQHSRLLEILNHIRQDVEQIIRFEKRILVKRGVLNNDYCRLPTFTTDAVFDAIFEELYPRIVADFTV
ncbi:MAG: dihydrodipicolinate synthase family protein [Verrucomicrobia bacterium]|nr:dihydrodipicolinate synthase family protein [Verrucomicrobiota bacterium]